MRLSGENTIWKFCTLHLDELKHHQKKPQKTKKIIINIHFLPQNITRRKKFQDYVPKYPCSVNFNPNIIRNMMKKRNCWKKLGTHFILLICPNNGLYKNKEKNFYTFESMKTEIFEVFVLKNVKFIERLQILQCMYCRLQILQGNMPFT